MLMGIKHRIYNLMFVPCIAGLCIENQHFALGFANIFITNAAPTCFGNLRAILRERLCPREYVKN
jgi:formate/nitrite transporter FocA (FNT family)